METTSSPFTFKMATEHWEFEQIHRLNYRTFVEEIPQHQPNSTGTLVDRFDEDNIYLICLRDSELIGMVTVREKRPFSLDQKLENLDAYLPQANKICEIRLLSVSPEHRHSHVFPGLIKLLASYCLGQGYDLAIISGTVRQLKLYRHMGFAPFGPLVGTSSAQYQPMYLTAEKFETHLGNLMRRQPPHRAPDRSSTNFLPGPVAIDEAVRQEFAAPAISHRSPKFINDFQEAKERLCHITGASFVEILCGTGTLANDAIACQLGQTRNSGIILSNGEFGERLIDQARQCGLVFYEMKKPWGKPFDYTLLESFLDRHPETGWLWAVHCETSTGILNNLDLLSDICSRKGIKLCMDCISSVGVVPVNLAGVHFASAVSGKGLRGYPGLAMVFYNHKLPGSTNNTPKYLDLACYAQCDGIPFTHPSNTFYALLTALRQFGDGQQRFELLESVSRQLRVHLKDEGFRLLADGTQSPAVITIAIDDSIDSSELGRGMEAEGYLLSYQSGYLVQRNWLQICLMGEYRGDEIEQLVQTLVKLSQSTSVRRPAQQMPTHWGEDSISNYQRNR